MGKKTPNGEYIKQMGGRLSVRKAASEESKPSKNRLCSFSIRLCVTQYADDTQVLVSGKNSSFWLRCFDYREVCDGEHLSAWSSRPLGSLLVPSVATRGAVVGQKCA